MLPVEPLPTVVSGVQSHRGWPLLRLAFRPFYLGAAVFAALAVPLWAALYLEQVNLDLALAPLLWHAHEMLFGFASAVIVGFLLTAGKVWTGLGMPRGAFLGALTMLWAGARLAGVVGPYAVYALLDLTLLPLVAALLFERLVRAGNRRNMPLAAILALRSLTNAAFHLAMIGAITMAPMAALHAGLALIVLIECVIAGRVVPSFTMSAIPGLVLAGQAGLERLTLAVSALALALWAFAPAGAHLGPFSAVALALAAVLHLVRQWRWRPLQTRSRPILWILHAAYAWIAIGFLLLALAQSGLVGESLGVHALAVGATGGLIIGMTTRTARGHTGRPIKASKAEVLAYVLMMATASLRVWGPLFAPRSLPYLISGAALAWCAAFVIYLVVCGPWLVTARRDGKDG
jgi:uncharacterized protein involved in response to NO